MKIVLDANVLVKWYVAEAEMADEAEYLTDERFKIQAPDLIIAEFGNILWKKHRRGELSREQVKKIIKESGLENELTLYSNEPLLEKAVEFAMETGQTVYDCLYLALAMTLDIPLVTADRRFFNGIVTTRYAGHLI